MRILISGSTYYPALNGQSIFTIHLAEGLVKKGHEVVMVYPTDRGRVYSDIRHGVQLETIPSLSLGLFHADAFFPLPSPRRIRQIFNDFQPDIVHVQDHYPICRTVTAEARKRQIKIVGTNHFMPENLAPYIPLISKIKPLYNWIMWTWVLDVYNRLNIVTTQSRISADILRANGLRVPAYTASCGIDLKRFYPDPAVDRKACREYYGLAPDRTLFLFVGRVDREKRIHVLLHAFHKLQRDDIQLVVAGKGAALEELRALASELNLGERVHFTGYIHEDLHDLLNCVDVFTMPSEAELLSIASLEAMACGLPIIVADAVALPELVTEGVNGYLFKPGDVDDAANVIERIADEPERWHEMGQVSLERSKYHSLESTIRRYEALYETTLNSQTMHQAVGVTT